MADVSVPWGQDRLPISLPAQWHLQQLAEPKLMSASVDWADRLGRALSPPAGQTSLAKLLSECCTGRVVLIVEDLTRHSPLDRILPILMREIYHAGLSDEQIEIVFANGMHPPLTPQEADEKLKGSCPTIPRRSNLYDNKQAHVFLGQAGGVNIHVDRGVVEADLRIIISAVVPHLQAGFGGAYKMLFPGCAHIETIRGLHKKGIGRRDRQLVGMDVMTNPMRQVIDRAGIMMDAHHGRSFAVQYLLDENDLPSYIAAGEVLPTHRMIAKQCAVSCGLVVPTPADVLITNAHPRDYDLWQSFKCIANTRWAVRPNGVIICLARCPAALGGMNVPRWPLGAIWTRRLVRWIGSEALCSLITRLIPSLASDAAFFVRMASQTIQRNAVFLVSENLCQAEVSFPGVQLFSTVDQAIEAAQAALGGGPQRVIVFPHGGTTFPIPTGRAGVA